MCRNLWALRGAAGIIGLGIICGAVAVPLPGEAIAQSPRPAQGEKLPTELQYVPTDAAIFLWVDAARVWDHPALKAIRKADGKTFEGLSAVAKQSFGMTPNDVKSIVLFIAKFEDRKTRVGSVVTFNKAFDKDKFTSGIESLLPKTDKFKVVAATDRIALVLGDLGDEFAKPQPAGKSGPLTSALQAAASGKHAAVAAITPASLPEIFRSDDPPAQFRPFQPLLKANAITAIVDLGKTFDLTIQVKTATARDAVDSEKALDAFLSMLAEGLGEELEQVERDVAKKPNLKDLLTAMKTASASLKTARFSTSGNETQATVSIPGDLPFTGAYLGARERIVATVATETSLNNLKQIALAVHVHADTHGTTPPAAICDKSGKRLLSWRVLLLPHLGEEKLFKEFKLDEPWDSEHNKKLLARMPKVYAIPGQTPPGGTDTHYRVFVGKDAGFDWLQGQRFPASFPDGTSNTIMCITAAEAVPWTKPDELEFDPEQDMGKLFGAVVNGKIQTSLFDGSARTLKKLPSKETLNALITRSGGEVIGSDFE